MKRISILLILLLVVTILLILGFNKIAGNTKDAIITGKQTQANDQNFKSQIKTIGEIQLPGIFTRTDVQPSSFGEWLRSIKLRKDNTVYLYNGEAIERQDLHYAVLDISTGNKDLQQCADAIMRLKAEYLFQRNEFEKINFITGNRVYNFADWLRHTNVAEKDKHALLLEFLEIVFMNCGTYTVEQMTKPVNIHDMQPGDLFVKAGSPGHAMIVVDVATNNSGKKIYMLAQGYMPAQDMHIVNNMTDASLSPWYEINDDEKIITPGWIFYKTQLRR